MTYAVTYKWNMNFDLFIQGKKEETSDHVQWSSLFSFSRLDFDSGSDSDQESLSTAGSPGSVPDYSSYSEVFINHCIV